MKIHGYEYDNENLLKLKETTIDCNLNELDKLIDFLLQIKKEHGAVSKETDMCHSHFRDWDNTWKKEDPDFIVVTHFE